MAREIFVLADEYDAQRAYEMGTVNLVVPHAELEPTAIAWGKRILTKSPTAIRMLKYAFNAADARSRWTTSAPTTARSR